jgi:autotransporter-associated beta strand protein
MAQKFSSKQLGGVVAVCVTGALVVSVPMIAAAVPANIDTNAPSYPASGLGITVNPVFQGGDLLMDVPSGTYPQAFTLSNSLNNAIDIAGNTSTFTGGFSDAVLGQPGNITFVNTGSGGLASLQGPNTYTGQTWIQPNAAVALAGGSSIAASSVVGVDGILDISGNGDTTVNRLAGSGVVGLGTSTLTIAGAVDPFAGTISGSGGVTIAGGSQVLTNVNGYTGNTTVQPGATLLLTTPNAIASSKTLVDNGVVDLTGSPGANVVSLSGAGTVLLGSGTLTLTAPNDTFAGLLSGAGGLVVTTTGTPPIGVTVPGNVIGYTEYLTNANTYTGATLITPGATLALVGSGSIAGSSTVQADGVFDISGTPASAITSLSGGGSVVLGSSTLTLTNANSTFFGVVSGTGGLTVAGGTEGLASLNSYTGATMVAPGATLFLAGQGGVPNSTTVVVNGQLDVSPATSPVIGSLSGNGAVILGGQTLTIAAAHDTFGGTISGAGGLALGGYSEPGGVVVPGTLLSGGTQVLTGINTYTGVTTINADSVLALAGIGSISTSAGVVANGGFDISASAGPASITTLSGTGTVTLGGNALVLTAANGSFGGVIGGPGSLLLQGGAQTLTGLNTYTGSTTLFPGTTLALAGAGSIASSSGVQADGTLDISGTTAGATITSLAGGGNVVLGTQSLALSAAHDTFAGNISGTGGLTLAGGTEALVSPNLYTGPTDILPGATLLLNGLGSIAASSAVTADGALDFTGTAGPATIANLFGSGTVLLGNGPLVLTAANGSFGGSIVGPNGLFVQGGAETLTGPNSYNGITLIEPGATLALAGAGSISGFPGVQADGTLDISGTTGGAAITTLSGGGYVTLGSKTLTLTVANGTFAGDVTGSGGLTIASGSETLTGFNDLFGATTVSPGAALVLAGAGTMPWSTAAVNGLLNVSGAAAPAVRSLTGSGSVLLGGQTLIIAAARDTFGGTIAGTGGLTIGGYQAPNQIVLVGSPGGGTEVLSGVNTYTGLTTINVRNILALSGAGSIATSSGVLDYGSFDISAASGPASITTLSGSGRVALGGNTLVLTAANGSFAGVIDGIGGLLIGTGAETLSGVNTYTGATTIGTGTTLALTGSGGVATSSGVAANGTLDISGTTAGTAVTTLSGTGRVTLGNQILTLTAAHDIFAGVIGGSGGLALTGGTEALSGTNTYTGATAIGTGSTLALVGSGSIAGSSALLDNGTLDVSGATTPPAIPSVTGSGGVTLGANTLTLTAANGTLGGVIAGTGGLAITGGAETLSGANTYTGATTVGTGATLALAGTGGIAASSGAAVAGTLDISGTTGGAALTTLSGGGYVALGTQTLALTAAHDTFSGTVMGSGSLSVTGGTEALTGTNTYTGGTTVVGAGVVVGSDAALGGAGGALALTNAVLAAPNGLTSSRSVVLTGSDTVSTPGSASLGGVVSGSGGLIAAGGGVITLSGANTYGGGTAVIDNTTLRIAADTALGAAGTGVSLTNATLTTLAPITSVRPVTLSGTGTLNTGGNTVALGGVVSGSGGLAVTGGGLLTLSGANTYAGGTRISGGATLAVASDSALGATGGGLTLGDIGSTGTLRALASFSSARNILVDAGGGLIDANGNTLTLTGVITQIGILQTTGGVGGQVLLGGPTTVQTFTTTGGTSSNTGNVNATTAVNVTGGSTFNNAGTVNTPSFSVSGTSNNGGVVNASSDSTVTSGGFLSNNGTLNSPSLTVDGELRGTGQVNAPTTVTGTLAPGNSPGTLTFNAPVTLTSSSIAAFDIDGTGTGTGAGNYSRVIINGAGNTLTAAGTLEPRLRGITGSATNTFSPVLGQRFQVVSAAGGVLGSFGSMVQPTGLRAGTRFDALYAPTTLTLVITPTAYGNLPLAGLGETSGERAVGAALDAVRPAAGIRMSNAAASLFYPLYGLPGPAIPAALDQLQPTIYGAGLLASRDTWYQITGTIGDQLAMRRYGMATANTAPGPNGSTIWVSGIGQFDNINGSGGPTAVHTALGGAVAGVDIPLPMLPNARVGFSIGGGSVQTSANGATDDGTAVQVSLYGGMTSGPFFADAQGSVLHMDQDIRRSLSLWGNGARGSGGIHGGGVQVDGGMHMAYGAWQVEPTLALSMMSLSGPGLTESSGGSLAETIGGESLTSLQSLAAVRFGTQMTMVPNMPMTVHALIGWQHEFLATSAHTAVGFGLGGTGAAFNTVAGPIARDAARLGAGVDVPVRPGVSLFGSYQAALGATSTAQYLTGGVKIVW